MIKVEMVCNNCGNVVEAETNAAYNSKNAIILYDHTTYICGECGKVMARKIVKTETTETETIIAEGN